MNTMLREDAITTYRHARPDRRQLIEALIEALARWI
jgi:hypothetical protein